MAFYQIFIQKVLPQHSVTVLIASLAYWQSIKWREIYVDMLNLEENLKNCHVKFLLSLTLIFYNS